MEKLIYALLDVERTAKRRIEVLSRRLEKTAAYAYGDTWAQIDAMLDIIEEKQAVERAVEIMDRLKKGLTDEEYEILRLRRMRTGYSTIAASLGVCTKTAYRKALEAIKTAQNILFLLGYDENRLKRDLGAISVVCDDAAA